jgi:hypothetical protein
VCKNAGKPKQLYLSHFTKDFKGNVICPTVLSFTCSQCGKKGHTAKLCNKKISASVSISSSSQKNKQIANNNTVKPKLTNIYDSFNDPEFIEPLPLPQPEPLPIKSIATSPVSTQTHKTWAQIIKTNTTDTAISNNISKQTTTTNITLSFDKVSNPIIPNIKHIAKWNWADDDSDDD